MANLKIDFACLYEGGYVCFTAKIRVDTIVFRVAHFISRDGRLGVRKSLVKVTIISIGPQSVQIVTDQ